MSCFSVVYTLLGEYRQINKCMEYNVKHAIMGHQQVLYRSICDRAWESGDAILGIAVSLGRDI